jgi:AhpD family alkylhydroperoxidase
MQPRIPNLHRVSHESYKALLALEESINKGPVSRTILDFARLRGSQINGCAFCVDMHAVDLKQAGESDERIFSISAWREAPFYTDEERAALALVESATRLADRGDAVPDEVWNEAAGYFDEAQLATLTMAIAAINAWNRINVINRTVAGSMRKAAATASA